jgi:deoxyhypusine synthase
VESAGLVHYKYDARRPDTRLYRMGYNRIYDTLEMEKNLNEVTHLLARVMEGLDLSHPLGSQDLCREIGKFLSKMTRKPGILRNAYLKKVPVFIPAFTDSEMALDLAIWHLGRTEDKTSRDWNLDQLLEKLSQFPFNPFLDLQRFTRKILSAKRLGIFTIGGGVPRNWAQQVGPFLDLLSYRFKRETPLVRYQYGVRICPEPVHWGGLSGCTYEEGISWGKFVPREEGGAYAEVLSDATIAWPILVKAVRERLDREKRGGRRHAKKKNP